MVKAAIVRCAKAQAVFDRTSRARGRAVAAVRLALYRPRR